MRHKKPGKKKTTIFGAKISELRNRRCLSMASLSRLSGVDCGYISNIEAGNRHASHLTCCKLADALGEDREVVWQYCQESRGRRVDVTPGHGPHYITARVSDETMKYLRTAPTNLSRSRFAGSLLDSLSKK